VLGGIIVRTKREGGGDKEIVNILASCHQQWWEQKEYKGMFLAQELDTGTYKFDVWGFLKYSVTCLRLSPPRGELNGPGESK
jgi:hypothetical protein